MVAPVVALLGAGFVAVFSLRNLVRSYLECGERTATENTIVILDTIIASEGDGEVRPAMVKTGRRNPKGDLYEQPEFKSLSSMIRLLGPAACYPAYVYLANQVG